MEAKQEENMHNIDQIEIATGVVAALSLDGSCNQELDISRNK